MILSISSKTNRYGGIQLIGANTLVFLTSGDLINVTLNDSIGKKHLKFTGKNSAHYNFFNELKKLKLVPPKFNEDIEDYITQCEKYYFRILF